MCVFILIKLKVTIPGQMADEYYSSSLVKYFYVELKVMEHKSQFCPNSTADQWAIANYIYSAIGVISLTITLLLLSLLILYKGFKTVLQRLFLYFTLEVIAADVVQVLNVELQFHDANRDFCKWLGFLAHWLSMSYNLLAVSLILYVSAITIQKARSQPFCKCSKKFSSKFLVSFEVLYLVATVIISGGVCLHIYLKTNNTRGYGLSRGECWLKAFDDNCTLLTDISYINYLDLPIPILRASLMFVFLALMIIFHQTVFRYKKNRKAKYSSLCKGMLFLSLVFVSLIAKVLSSFVHINKISQNFYFVFFDELVQLISFNLLILVFAVYLYSPKKT